MHDWDEIQRKYSELVFAASYRILKDYQLASDTVQDVFLDAHQRLRGKVVENWPALLRWLAVRRALDCLRSEKARLGRFEFGQLDGLPAKDSRPGDRIEFEELMVRLRFEVTVLPQRQAEAFWLHCVEQLSANEVASQMGLDPNAVRVLIHRARIRLNAKLADLKPEPK